MLFIKFPRNVMIRHGPWLPNARGWVNYLTHEKSSTENGPDETDEGTLETHDLSEVQVSEEESEEDSEDDSEEEDDTTDDTILCTFLGR